MLFDLTGFFLTKENLNKIFESTKALKSKLKKQFLINDYENKVRP